MKFCDDCDNMLYISVEDTKLVHYCKNCEFSTKLDYADSAICILQNKLDDNISTFTQFMNKNIIHDPTLPRVSNIKCTNIACSKDHEQPNEVIYIKYDHTNMKFLYYCCHCESFWI
jgi:DNA-directed RNA polymerase subunit M/transcription elongation factor TFIIS